LILTRGAALARGYQTTGDELGTRILMQYEWSPEPPQRPLAGVAVRRGRLRFSQNADLAGIKHLNRLEQVLARREWSDPEYFESVHLTGSGCLASGTMSNLFLVLGGQLVTPSVDYCGVAGVMRELVLERAREAGIGTRVDTLAPELLDIAEELFLTNVRIGIVPIVRIGEQRRPAGPLTRRLQELLIDAR
jgi:4-amino-4-deoxychorismate lyase